MADATKIYLLWAGNTGNVPADWTYESGFDNKFIRGNDTYGGTAGSNTHTHTISSPVCQPTGDAGPGQTGIAKTIAGAIHTHTLAGGACGNSTNLPPYRTLIVISAAVATTTIPTSVIAVFESAPASGFTAYAAANSKYVRGGNAVGNGGASTHTHTYSVVTGNNDLSETFEVGPASKAAHTHDHTVNINSATGNWRPPGVKVRLYSSDSGQNMPADLVAFFNGDPPAADWDIVSGVATNYYQRLLYADTSHGTTGASHGHSVSGASDPPSATDNISDFPPEIPQWTGENHTHTVTCTLNSSAPLPIYIDVVFGKFKGVAPPPTPPANPLIGKPLICPDIIQKAKIR